MILVLCSIADSVEFQADKAPTVTSFIDSRMLVAGTGHGQDWGASSNGYRVSVGEPEHILKVEDNDHAMS